MSELNKITHDPKLIKTLESKGITSLEQLVLSTPELLGITESKGRQVIEAAMIRLSEENIERINIDSIVVEVILKYSNRAILESILYYLGANEDGCVIKHYPNSIKFIMKSNKKRFFSDLIKKARKLKSFLSMKRVQIMKEEGITLKPNDIIAFAKEKQFEGFYEEFFSDIIGNALMKKAITVSLFSTPEEPIHVLILGDPGSAKTLAREILINNISGINSIGANATKSGLVCNLSNGDLGALAVSDRRVVLIDEFDKINKNDLEYCYELLSNGKCSVHAARVHKDIVSHFILIAFGNPKSEVFNKAMPLDDIGMEKTLLSRFAMIVKTDSLTKFEKENLFRKRLLGESKLSESSQMFDQWIKLSRTHMPQFKSSKLKIDELVRKATDIVEQHSTTQLRRDLRMGDYFRRIAMSFARIDFTDVTDEIINKSYNLIKESIDVWSFSGGELDFLR